MHTGTISFCDQSGLNIKSHDVKEAITKTLEAKYRVKIIQRHYDKLDRAVQLPKMQANPHLVCLRSNGNPYYLFLTRYQFVNQCFFIDKKVQGGYNLPRIIISKLRFADELFEEDTLLEGEMVKDAAGNWIYLIHDLIAYKGKYLESEPVVKRLNMIYDILETRFKPDDTDVCAVQVKKYVTYDRIKELVYDFMPTLPYTCRGLYLKPLYRRFLDFLFNFDESLIVKVERIKYQQKNGFNASTEGVGVAEAPSPKKLVLSAQQQAQQQQQQVVSGGSGSGERTMLIEKTHNVDVYNLYDPVTKAPMGTAGIVTTAMSLMLQELFAPVNTTTRFTVKCSFHERFKKWQPMKVVTA